MDTNTKMKHARSVLDTSPPAASRLLSLPSEIISRILLFTTTPSFIQTISSCRHLFHLAENDRKVVLRHIHQIPGIKLGLDDPCLPTKYLFRILRQRASKHLIGTYFSANCHHYVAKTTHLNVAASCLDGLDADYLRMSLVLKHSLIIRHYTTHCELKERIDNIYPNGGAEILQVVHRKSCISVLISCPGYERLEDSDTDSTSSQDERPSLSAKQELLRLDHMTVRDRIRYGVRKPEKKRPREYHLLHFDAYSNGHPLAGRISPPKGLAFRHLAVQSRTCCAILWDGGEATRPLSHRAEVVLYLFPELFLHDEAVYIPKTIWPLGEHTTPRPGSSDDSDDSGEEKICPKQVAFFRHGRRLRLYAAGQALPIKVVVALQSSYENYQPSNQVEFDHVTFQVDCPFFGTHETVAETKSGVENALCYNSHLCLGVATLNGKIKVLCILRSRTCLDSGHCSHVVNLDQIPHVSAESVVAVARLWGWRELPTSIPGLDTIRVSPSGSRIAVSLWNKVLVYDLEPSMLCGDFEHRDDEANQDGTARRRGKKRQAKSEADEYYERKVDPYLRWEMVGLRPIVLDLGGAVAHKLSWTGIKHQGDVDEADEETYEDFLQRPVESRNAVKEDGPVPHAEELAWTNGQSEGVNPSGTQQDTVAAGQEGGSPSVTNGGMATLSLNHEHVDDKTVGSETPPVPQPPQLKPDPPTPLDGHADGEDVNEPGITNSPPNHPGSSGPRQKQKTAVAKDLDAGHPGQGETEAKAWSSTSLHTSSSGRPRWSSPRPYEDTFPCWKRRTEDELVILTDQGVQVWCLGPGGQGLRTRSRLDLEESLKGKVRI